MKHPGPGVFTGAGEFSRGVEGFPGLREIPGRHECRPYSRLFHSHSTSIVFPTPFIASPALSIVFPNPSVVFPTPSIVFPAKAGIQKVGEGPWIPAFAGMTER